MKTNIKFDLPQNEGNIIKVIGVGGGGNNAVKYMFEQGILGVDFAICNTDRQALMNSSIPVKIQLGPELTEGKGAGNKPEVGRQACLESIEDVKSFLATDTKMLFITAGMGGGTGTGAAPVIAKAAKEMGILTIGIVTKPFGFEGKKRREHGDNGIADLRNSVDTLIVISNDKLNELFPDLSLRDAFGKADDILAIAAKGIAEIITKEGYVNVDFNDVDTVMRDSGVAVMGTATASGEDRVEKAVNLALKSPLLENNDINGAQSILLNITTGSSDVTTEELFSIMNKVQEAAGDTDLIWGNCYDQGLGDALSVTIIATGFGKKAEAKQTEEVESVVKQVEKRNVVQLDDADNNFFELEESTAGRVFEFEPGTGGSGTRVEFKTQDDSSATAEKTVLSKRNMKRTAIDPSKLDNESLYEFENVPAYKRKEVVLEDQVRSDDAMSGMAVSGKNEEKIIYRNSFLHDNVD